MLDKTLAYHLEQRRQNQTVLDTDGNIFSDQHRSSARKALDLHNTIITELDAATARVDPAPALDTLTVMLAEMSSRIHVLERMEDAAGPGISRQMMLQEIETLTPQRAALEVAVRALREIAARPALTHRKGGSYDEYGRGTLQTDTPLIDKAALVAYRDRTTGRWFFRPPSEMDDGRFTAFDPDEDPAKRQVLIKIDGLDDRRITFDVAEIARMERGGLVKFSASTTGDEDLWGTYKPIDVTYVGTGVSAFTLKLL